MNIFNYFKSLRQLAGSITIDKTYIHAIQLMFSAFYWCCMTSYSIYWDLFESKIKLEQYRWVATGDPQKVFLISILMQYLFLFCFTRFLKSLQAISSLSPIILYFSIRTQQKNPQSWAYCKRNNLSCLKLYENVPYFLIQKNFNNKQSFWI